MPRIRTKDEQHKISLKKYITYRAIYERVSSSNTWYGWFECPSCGKGVVKGIIATSDNKECKECHQKSRIFGRDRKTLALRSRFPSTFKSLGIKKGKSWSAWFECPICKNGILRESTPIDDNTRCMGCVIQEKRDLLEKEETFIRYSEGHETSKGRADFSCPCGCDVITSRSAVLESAGRVPFLCASKKTSFLGVAQYDNSFMFRIRTKIFQCSLSGFKTGIEAAVAKNQLIIDMGLEGIIKTTDVTDLQMKAYKKKEPLYVRPIKANMKHICEIKPGKYLVTVVNKGTSIQKNASSLKIALEVRKNILKAVEMMEKAAA